MVSNNKYSNRTEILSTPILLQEITFFRNIVGGTGNDAQLQIAHTSQKRDTILADLNQKIQ